MLNPLVNSSTIPSSSVKSFHTKLSGLDFYIYSHYNRTSHFNSSTLRFPPDSDDHDKLDKLMPIFDQNEFRGNVVIS